MLTPASSRGPADGRLLSVIVPVFNEAATVAELLRLVLAQPLVRDSGEVIVVDDGSTDGTRAVLDSLAGELPFRRVELAVNAGKGAAVRAGLESATGAWTVIQDADLEYDPADYPRLLEPLRAGVAEVCYGSRYHPSLPRRRWTRFRVAVALLNLTILVLWGRRIGDAATCYKVLPTALLRDLKLTSRRFELCSEITGRLCQRRVSICEVAIGYRPRSRSEGKKIRATDFFPAIRVLVRERLAPVPAKVIRSRLPADADETRV